MRPVRLVMQAFGPYAGREVVDFGDAVSAGLFGIYGQTGAGKSTIFSAITFALFGSATKEEQEPASLRSDHANPTDRTVVELIFDLGDRRYMILRSPEQPRPKRRGDGETWEAHEAYLFDVTGQSCEDIDRGARGKVIAEKKTGAVLSAVTELLGYGPRQFRQIVLLPQGRFETFLAANTKDRLEILRDLFDVSLYRRLTARLKADAEEAEREVRTQRAACAARLAMDGFESTEALDAGVVEATSIHSERLMAETARQADEKSAATALAAAKELDGRFSAADTAAQARDALLQAKTGMDALASRIGQAEAARGALDRETSMTRAAAEAVEAASKCRAAKALAEQAQSASDAAKIALDAEFARDAEFDELRRELDDLRRHEKTIADSSGARQAADDAAAVAKAAAEARATAESAHAELLENRLKAATVLQRAKQTEDRRRIISADLTMSVSAMKAAEAYEKAEADLENATKAATQLELAHDTASAQAAAAKEAFEAAEARLSEMQALHLASKLVVGEPCPVCGATDHPSPATGRAEEAGLDRAFREAKARWHEKDEAARMAASDYVASFGVLGERRRAFAGHQRPVHSAHALRQEINERGRQLEALGEPAQLEALASTLDALEKSIADAETEREGRREAASLAATAAATSAARLDQMLASVPQSLRGANLIATALVERQRTLQTRVEARARAETAARTSREAALSAAKDLEAAEASLALAKDRHVMAGDSLAARLREDGLTIETFAELKTTIPRIEADRAIVDEHRLKLQGAEEHLRQCQAVVEGRTRPPLAEFEQASVVAAQALMTATEERAAAHARLSHLTRLSSELSGILRQLDESEAATGPLRLLASQFDAGNPHKLDLETYAIGAMFDAVLEAANLRAGPMTGGRYKLEREAEGGGRGRKGLGIQVFDAYTGKSRPASTLSGGETFIAALALALGLADVVESASGKVRLDTVFIDEGFGSLDAENGAGTLDLVLRVLSNLTSVNRAVGLISHVPLVQEAIPHGFYVMKSGAGSTIETRRRI